jgi:hypothetical protein
LSFNNGRRRRKERERERERERKREREGKSAFYVLIIEHKMTNAIQTKLQTCKSCHMFSVVDFKCLTTIYVKTGIQSEI